VCVCEKVRVLMNLCRQPPAEIVLLVDIMNTTMNAALHVSCIFWV